MNDMSAQAPAAAAAAAAALEEEESEDSSEDMPEVVNPSRSPLRLRKGTARYNCIS